ncbi:hypothetical protein [Spirosoma validum]|uniref:Uncharacterized protein n=1 Tax=Spirosoma validum TaxID=2771355 RepID=A0A927B6K1_9BACT|nr:hypothetical protein [Spirosoma validum]MBD2756649.1 hypothetical protein [Spirosoma validum]
MKYGQQEYDFDEGILFFMALGQVLKIETEAGSSRLFVEYAFGPITDMVD